MGGRVRPGGPEPERYLHEPVLLRETVEYLAVRPGCTYIDLTVGEGGHARAMLQQAMPGGRLLGIDLDPMALERARHRLQAYGESCSLVHGNYSHVEQLASVLVFSEPDGILMDLGLSSFQLESTGRGFSFQRDEPLDMRFDWESGPSAADIINSYPADVLAKILTLYGQEPRARSIAKAVVQQRPIRSTMELANLVARASGGRRGPIHPATRTFQALRLAVNSELDNLKAGMTQAMKLLKRGGRLVVISYHSLEARIIKEAIAQEAKGCICPPRAPICTCGHTPSIKIVTRKAVAPSPEEVRRNPRSRSARMRVVEHL